MSVPDSLAYSRAGLANKAGSGDLLISPLLFFLDQKEEEK